MPHAAAQHLDDERVVSRDKVLRLEEPVGRKSTGPPAGVSEVPDRLMDLVVFAEEVTITEHVWWHHPHTHGFISM